MYSGTVRLKGRNPLPKPDPGDGPRIGSISHDKRPRGSLKPRSMTAIYYKKCLQKLNKFILLYTFQYTIYYLLNNNNDNNNILLLLLLLSIFFTSRLWLGNIHLSWDVVINRIRLGGLTRSLKSFLQLNMCQELQIFAAVYICIGVQVKSC